ncbi:WhiB family transcriptional regulator [Streptomyces sp. NPDC001054]
MTRSGGRPHTLTALKRQPAPTPSVPDWRHQALCRDEDPELFFPLGETGPGAVQIEEAKKICKGCPVRSLCLEFALDTRQQDGVWGGTSPEDRRRMHRSRRRKPPATETAAA